MMVKSDKVNKTRQLSTNTNKDHDLELKMQTIHNLQTRLQEEKIRAKDERVELVNIIKQLKKDRDEQEIRFEGKLS